MIVYTIVSPLMGWLGDRYNRRMILAGGVGLWSLATVGTAFSAQLLRACSSGGRCWESARRVTGSSPPPCWRTCFAVEKRGRAMGIYYLALPIGTALGFIIAGRVASHWGWHHVFLVVGIPGLAGGPGRADYSRPRPGCL